MNQRPDLILILDFGSQYTQLIARRIRETGIYSVVKSYDIPISEIKKIKPKGIILSGGPNSVNFKKTLRPSKMIYKLDIPILGICYGMQLITKEFGGLVIESSKKEFGHSEFKIKRKSKLFNDINSNISDVWMSHSDKVKKLPKGFVSLGESTNSQVAALQNDNLNI